VLSNIGPDGSGDCPGHLHGQDPVRVDRDLREHLRIIRLYSDSMPDMACHMFTSHGKVRTVTHNNGAEPIRPPSMSTISSAPSFGQALGKRCLATRIPC